MHSFSPDHVLSPEEQRLFAEEIELRATQVTASRDAMVRWGDVLYIDLTKERHAVRDARRADEFLDFLERSGRVVARVGTRYILRPESEPAQTRVLGFIES